MSTLLHLLAQKSPQIQTHQALVVLDLQNDFLLPAGKLPISSRSAFLSRIKTLVDVFRENAGDVIWVRSTYEADRHVNDKNEHSETIVTHVEAETGTDDSGDDRSRKSSLTTSKPTRGTFFKRISRKSIHGQVDLTAAVADDPEHFLSSTPTRKPCCMPNSRGAEFADDVRGYIDTENDVLLNKSYYSAFKSTPLLVTLRSRLITEFYICGCMTNVSVYATALDAARHGLTINIVEDCVGFRKASRHREAMRQMVDIMGAFVVTSGELVAELEDNDTSAVSTGDLSPETTRADVLALPLDMLGLSTTSSLYTIYPDGTRASDERPTQSEIPSQEWPIAEPPISPVQSDQSRLDARLTISPSPPEEFRSVMRSPTSPAAPDRGSLDPRPTTFPSASEQVMSVTRPTISPTPPELVIQGNKSGKLPMKQLEPRLETENRETKNSSTSRIRMRNRGSSALTDSMGAADNEDSLPKKTLEGVPTLTPPEYARRASGQPARQTSPLSETRQTSIQELVANPRLSPLFAGDSEAVIPRLFLNSNDDSISGRSLASSTSPSSFKEPETRLTDDVISPVTLPLPKKSDLFRTEIEPPTSTSLSSSTPDNMSLRMRLESTTQLGSMDSKKTSMTSLPMPAPETALGEGDSFLSTNLLPPQLSAAIFQELYGEVRWQTMSHQTGLVPRLVCAQGDFGDDGSHPIYRHPSDQALPLLHFCPAVQLVRRHVEKIARHPLNHVLVQLYRSGQDCISEHSDKTLDIVRGSSIVNVSFGAQRIMRLRTKKSALNQRSVSFTDAARQTIRIPLPHNSAFVLGQETNMRWLHGINADKRAARERSDAEKAFGGMRISLTFRLIGTFLSGDESLIWGQGASGKTREVAHNVINNDIAGTDALVRAFGMENQASEFDWPGTYGAGFDVLNFREGDIDVLNAALLFLSNDRIQNEQVLMYLHEAGVEHAAIPAPTKDDDDRLGCLRKVFFRDSDALHTEVTGSIAVLLYLNRLRPLPHPVAADGADEQPIETRATIARVYELVNLLAEAMVGVRRGEKWLLNSVEGVLGEQGYITGRDFSFADCAYFPVLELCLEGWDERVGGHLPRLRAYMERMRMRVEARKSLAATKRVTSR